MNRDLFIYNANVITMDPLLPRARSLVVSNYGRKGAMPGPDISMPIAWLAGLLYGLSGKRAHSRPATMQRAADAASRRWPGGPQFPETSGSTETRRAHFACCRREQSQITPSYSCAVLRHHRANLQSFPAPRIIGVGCKAGRAAPVPCLSGPVQSLSPGA